MIEIDTMAAAAAIGAEAVNGAAQFFGFATDSRDVKKGDMFLCISGEKTDGHLYASVAEKNGAAAFLCDKDINTSLPYIKADSTIGAIQRLAFWYRKNIISDVKITAVTGSVGKTTTKEFIAAVLSNKMKTYKTRGNKNSETGLPITILETSKDDSAAVVEMGMSNLGEIEVLSKIGLPDVAVITNIGMSHIENLGSRENIYKAKSEITAGLRKDGLLILNGDDDMLQNGGNLHSNVVFYGINNKKAAFFADEISFLTGKSIFTAHTPSWTGKIELPVLGTHNIYNALAAIAVGHNYSLTYEKISEGLKNYKTVSSRQNIYSKNGFTIFDDCYNASPSSVESAAEVFKTLAGRKIAVLGDMLELGSFSSELHRLAGEKLGGIDVVILYGDYAKDYAAGASEAGVKNIHVCKDRSEASEILTVTAEKGDCILFKASRGMAAEKIIDQFFLEDNEL